MADQTVTTSKQFTININDFWKGLIVAVISAPLTTIYTSLSAGTFTIDWKAVGLVAVTGLVSYLMKNFFSAPVTIVKPPATEPGTTTASVSVQPTDPK